MVVEAIKKIAEKTEKVTEEIVDALPEGILKQTLWWQRIYSQTS